MDKAFRWHMLITSFIPLWISIIIVTMWDMVSGCYISVVDFFQQKYIVLSLSLFIIVITSISLVSFTRFFKMKSKKTENSGVAKIIRAKKSSKLVSDFLLAYVLPMIAFDFTDLQGITLFIVYFAVLSFLSVRNNNVYTNILLEFKRYRMYDCEIECQVAGKQVSRPDCTIFSKSNLVTKIGAEITYYDFDNDIYIDLTHTIKGVKS